MCIYITGTLASEANTLEIEDLFRKNELVIKPLKNKHILSQLPSNDKYYSFTDRGCDCDSGLGSHSLVYIRYDHPEYKKMSDSEWEDHLKILEGLGFDIHERNQKLIEDAERWFNFITELIENKGISRFGLLIHFYTSGGVEEEKFKINDIVQKKVSEVNADFLVRIEADVLYQFIA